MRVSSVISVVTVALSLSCHQFKSIEKKPGDPWARVRGTVPHSIEAVAEALEVSRPELERYTPRGFVPEAEYLRPTAFIKPYGTRGLSEFDVRRLAESANPWLTEYLKIPESERAYDLKVRWLGDVFWPAEAYLYDGGPAKFTTSFLIHFEAVDQETTAIEILEMQPIIWVGKKFGVGAHGPGRFRDYRDVDQSLSERVDLLDFIRRLIQQSAALHEREPVEKLQ